MKSFSEMLRQKKWRKQTGENMGFYDLTKEEREKLVQKMENERAVTVKEWYKRAGFGYNEVVHYALGGFKWNRLNSKR